MDKFGNQTLAELKPQIEALLKTAEPSYEQIVDAVLLMRRLGKIETEQTKELRHLLSEKYTAWQNAADNRLQNKYNELKAKAERGEKLSEGEEILIETIKHVF